MLTMISKCDLQAPGVHEAFSSQGRGHFAPRHGPKAYRGKQARLLDPWGCARSSSGGMPGARGGPFYKEAPMAGEALRRRAGSDLRVWSTSEGAPLRTSTLLCATCATTHALMGAGC